MAGKKHPLRALRAATPHRTQAAFAAFLGVPVVAVQAVECGRARPTPRMAARIRERTGPAAAQAVERAKGEAVRRAHDAAWRRLAEEARGDEDYLVPWQTCEFASASGKEWQRVAESRVRLTGWSGALPQTKLTLAVQVAPLWNPDAPPPGMGAANEELFPPCYFTVAAGSGGCRVAAAYWRALCREHAICAETGASRDGAPTGSWRGFFRALPQQCEPHAVFAGLDDAEAAELGGLFARGGILRDGAGEVLRFMEEHSEDAGSPAGILLFATLEGGTASALGCELLARLRTKFPAMPILVIGVLPLAGVSSVVTAPWHVALALQAIRRHASAALLFSNDQLLASAARDWHLPQPGYAEANLLIAECLSALTAPLRFGGSDTPPVDLRELLAGFAADDIPLLTAQCRPLAALADRRLKATTLPWLMQRAVKVSGMEQAPALAAFLRVRLEPGDAWVQDDAPLHVRLTGRTGVGLHESAVVVAESPVIRRTLHRLARQARELLKLESAPSLCAQLGVSMEEVRAAVEALS